mmetsp:Transcript_22620/g.31489  ORF Transcript_22620/g.31489 Transcript_22620/m.31489 type:complete len:598 (+) Transcript_22620:152-1945(+)
MSARGLTPIFKWGFGFRRSNFLVPLISNNILVSGEEAVATQQSQTATLEISLNLEDDLLVDSKQDSSVDLIVDKVIERLHSKNTSKQLPVPSKDLPTQPSKLTVTEVALSPSKSEGNNSPIKPSPLRTSYSFNNTPQTNAHELTSSSSTTLRTSPSLPNLNCSLSELSDDEIISLVEAGKLQAYRLESDLRDPKRAVQIRRQLLSRNLNKTPSDLNDLPVDHYDYAKIQGACCENVVGYVTVPVGVAGPLLVDGQACQVPLATTEGALVASTTRGCKAITQSGGARTYIVSTGMTRAPVVKMRTAGEAVELKKWLEDPTTFAQLSEIFNSTSRFANLVNIKVMIAGLFVYIRFKSTTGDAMGMNIIGKAVEKTLLHIQTVHPMKIISLSGNVCTDKKPSSLNWTEGRGRSVVCEAVIKKDIVSSVLKTSVEDLIELNVAKNLIGSAMAGSIGGFNAHAANLVAAVFLATGQDIAQTVESANCMTLIDQTSEGDLHISVTMPTVEVGTIGGGTFLPAQSSCLGILGVKGPCSEQPGKHADRLASVVAATVLAGELSLMSALAAGHLMKSHLSLNRSATTSPDVSRSPSMNNLNMGSSN